MALDWGEVRIGVAVSDPLRITARALTTLTHRDAASDVQAIRRLVEQHEITQLVVGHPVHMGGERGRTALAVERFRERLQAGVSVPVRLWDERLTTREAEHTLGELKVKAWKRAGAIDRFAAAIILRDFLEFERQRSAHGADSEEETVRE